MMTNTTTYNDKALHYRNASTTARGASNGNTVEGYAAVYNSTTDLGPVYETIAPGAFDGADLSDVRLLVNHDGVPLARSKSGTLHLEVNDRGLRYLAVLDNTSAAANLTSAARRGDISESSFGFTIAAQRWDRMNGKPHRIIEKIAKVIDVSPVTYPAYQETSFGAV